MMRVLSTTDSMWRPDYKINNAWRSVLQQRTAMALASRKRFLALTPRRDPHSSHWAFRRLRQDLGHDTSPRQITGPLRHFVKKVTNYLKPDAESRIVARELVVLSLQSLKESSPALPPLESVLGGLLQLVNTYEVRRLLWCKSSADSYRHRP